jgi:oligosaccharide repeat unit polymerase
MFELDVFYFLLFVLLISLFIIFSSSRNLLNPYVILSIGLILESTLPIIYLLNNGGFNRIVNSVYGFETHMIYSTFIFIFIFIFVFILYLSSSCHSFSNKLRAKLETVKCISQKSELIILLICLGIVLPGMFILVSILINVGINSYFSNRIILFSGLGFVLSTFKISQLGALVIIANQVVKKYKYGLDYHLFITLFSLFLAVLPAILMGSRSQIFIPIVGMITVYLVITKDGTLNLRSVIKPLSAGFIILFLALNLGNVRESIMSDNVDEISAFSEEGVIEGLAFTYGSSENLLWLIENDKPDNYLYGQTYFAALVGFIPRSLWKDKPFGGGPYMQNLISAGSYDQNGTNISSTTTGVLAELYLNFGIVGMVLGPFLFFVLIIVLFKVVFIFNGVLFVALFSALLFRVFGYINAEFFGVTSHIITLLAAAIIIKLIIGFSDEKNFN